MGGAILMGLYSLREQSSSAVSESGGDDTRGEFEVERYTPAVRLSGRPSMMFRVHLQTARRSIASSWL